MITPDPTSRRAAAKRLSPKATVILIAVVVFYIVLRPTLSNWLGIPLPALIEQEPVVDAGPAPVAPRAPLDANAEEDIHRADNPVPDASIHADSNQTQGFPPADAASRKSEPAPPVDAETSASQPPTPPSAKPSPRSTSPRGPPAAPARKLGQLTDLGRGRFRSTAGLIYEDAGSEHRIDHVLRHAVDDPSRPVHGVFSGEREQILAVIDEGWQLAQSGRPPKVETEEQGDRTVYIIDLGRKIGFMGGQAGKRRNFPACRHLQLVLEGNGVITAYPVIPR
jgi:hypothetical protein